jgi:PKD repeat protein
MSLDLKQDWAFNQSDGNVTVPVNSSYIQAYAQYLGITEPVNLSWLQAICVHFGITEPLYGSWLIALANYYGITEPVNGSWWYAIAQAGAPEPGILPVANFTSNVTTIFENDSVDFEDTSTVPVGGSPITNWLWTFEGGTPGTAMDQNPTITYDVPGEYQVSLQVTNADGSNTKTVPGYITVEAIPVTSNSIINFNSSMLFNMLASNETKYASRMMLHI